MLESGRIEKRAGKENQQTKFGLAVFALLSLLASRPAEAQTEPFIKGPLTIEDIDRAAAKALDSHQFEQYKKQREADEKRIGEDTRRSIEYLFKGLKEPFDPPK